jgi:hypothetical protein
MNHIANPNSPAKANFFFPRRARKTPFKHGFALSFIRRVR